MPQLTTLVLKDRLDADHTFNPRGIANGVATVVSGTGVPIGNISLTISRTRTPQGREKATIKFVVPVVQNVTVSGITKPTVVRAAYADLTISFDSGSDTNERADLLAYLASFLGDEFAESVVVDLEDVY